MTPPAEARVETQDFRIRGMDCAEECAILRREVGPVVGGEEHLSFDILRGRMSVTGGRPALADAVIKAVARTGMHAQPWTAGDERQARQQEAAARSRRTNSPSVMKRSRVPGPAASSKRTE